VKFNVTLFYSKLRAGPVREVYCNIILLIVSRAGPVREVYCNILLILGVEQDPYVKFIFTLFY